MKRYESKRVRITSSISDHCGLHKQGHPDKCLQITQAVFPNILWQFMGRDGDRCVFEAYVDPSIAEIYEQETGSLRLQGTLLKQQGIDAMDRSTLNALCSLQHSATGEPFRA